MSIQTPVTCKSRNPYVQRLIAELNKTTLSVESFAELAGLDRDTIYNWARARQNPTIPNIVAAFNALGFTLTVTTLGE